MKNSVICDIIKAKSGVEMYRDRGVYVFPDKDMMRIFAYDGEYTVEYPSLTFAKQLVDFLQIDMTSSRKTIKNFRLYDDKTVDCKLLMNNLPFRLKLLKRQLHERTEDYLALKE